MSLEDCLPSVAEQLTKLPIKEGLSLLYELSKALPPKDGQVIRTTIAATRVLVEEGENVADAVRKVRAIYSARAQEIANTFER
jgi:hypothetical protein